MLFSINHNSSVPNFTRKAAERAEDFKCRSTIYVLSQGKATGITRGSCVSILVHFSNGTCLKCYLRGVIGRGQSVIFLRESPDIGCQSVCMTEFGLFLKKANFIFP